MYFSYIVRTILLVQLESFQLPYLFWRSVPVMSFLGFFLSLLYRRLECIGKPGLQGLAYSSLCGLCTGWRSHNPQTDLNSSRKALDPESTHFLQTALPKREGVFGHGWNPWLKSATSGHRHTCASKHMHVHTHTNNPKTPKYTHTPPQPLPTVGERLGQLVERASLSSY